MSQKKFILFVVILLTVLFSIMLTAHLLSRDLLRSCTAFTRYVQKAHHLAYLRTSWDNPNVQQRMMRKMTKIAPFRQKRTGEKYMLEFDNLSPEKIQNLVSLIYRHPVKLDELELVHVSKGKYTMRVKVAR